MVGLAVKSLIFLHSTVGSLSGTPDAVHESREAVTFAKARYNEGGGDLLDVLVEQQRLNVAEVDEVRSKTALVLVWVRLHKALGGGPRR